MNFNLSLDSWIYSLKSNLPYIETVKPSSINFFASTPCLFVAPALFVSSIFLQGLLVLIVSIYSIISFGSGLKQVYLLRNIEVVLLIVSLTFGTSILGGV